MFKPDTERQYQLGSAPANDGTSRLMTLKMDSTDFVKPFDKGQGVYQVVQATKTEAVLWLDEGKQPILLPSDMTNEQKRFDTVARLCKSRGWLIESIANTLYEHLVEQG